MTKRFTYKNKYCSALKVNLWGKQQLATRFLKKSSGLRVKSSEYGQMLIAKQKLRSFYGNIVEKQFRNLYKKTNISMLSNLERRLDIIIFRMKFASSIFEARQLINHGFIMVNKQKVTIASYLLVPGDTISVVTKAHKQVYNNIVTHICETHKKHVKLNNFNVFLNKQNNFFVLNILRGFLLKRFFTPNLFTNKKIVNLMQNFNFKFFLMSKQTACLNYFINTYYLNFYDKLSGGREFSTTQDNILLTKIDDLKILLDKNPFFLLPNYIDVNFKILTGIYLFTPKTSDIHHQELINMEEIKNYYTR